MNRVHQLKRFLKNCREWVWPTMGWKRFTHFQFLRLSRMSGGSRAIARGFACGVAVSFTPFVGLHFVLAGAAAKLMRGNIIASLIGTAVGNPWTFPFIWPGIYSIGNQLLNVQPETALDTHDNLSWSTLLNHPFEVFVPMLIGSIPVICVVWPLAYLLLLHIMRWLKARRRKAFVTSDEKK